MRENISDEARSLAGKIVLDTLIEMSKNTKDNRYFSQGEIYESLIYNGGVRENEFGSIQESDIPILLDKYVDKRVSEVVIHTRFGKSVFCSGYRAIISGKNKRK